MANYRRKRSKSNYTPTIRYRINEYIKAKEVRVVSDEDGLVGVMPTSKAILIAKEREVDLVEINPKAEPPVCKLVEYNKLKYQLEKSAKQSKPKEDKTLRVSVRVSDNDLQVRGNQAGKFLEKGHKVKLQVQMRGREKAYPEVAKEVIEKFLGFIEGEYTQENDLKLTGDSYFAFLKPKKG